MTAKTWFMNTFRIVVIFYLYGCQQKTTAKNPYSSLKFSNTLATPADFQAFCGAPLEHTYSGVKSVKVMYDIAAKKLYFINSNYYRLHFEFGVEELGYPNDLFAFNSKNYEDGSNRQFYLATINYYNNLATYTLEFSSYDKNSASNISSLYREIAVNSFIKDSLKVLINSDALQETFATNAYNLPLITPDVLYGAQSFQCIQKGTTKGYLRWLPNLEDSLTTVRPSDIVITTGTPIEIPVCKAILTNAFQTPLSHIQVLTHNRKIPSAVVKNIANNFTLQQWNRLPVQLTVTNDTFYIEKLANNKDIIETSVPISLQKLKANTVVKGLINMNSSNLKNNTVGGKATGMGILAKVAKKDTSFRVPEGAFAIPFYYYHQHVGESSIQLLIKKLATLSDNKEIETCLKSIQKAILEKPLDTNLLHLIENKITQQKQGDSYRFRSSSNAEDIEGFTGAGLYESRTGIRNNAKKSFEKAVKKVWAGVFNYRAYQERKLYHLDEKMVKMGILVHRSFPDEKCNGVIITKNLYRDDFPAILINVQKGDVGVVDAKDSVTCEQIIVSDAALLNPSTDKEVEIKYITYSSLNNQRPILTTPQIIQLFKAVDKIQQSYNGYLDIEFKIDKTNKLYIKQVRPFY